MKFLMKRDKSNNNIEAMAHSITSVSILIVGAGGYGRDYMQAMEDLNGANIAHVSAIIDPVPPKIENYPGLQTQNIPQFSDLDAYFRSGLNADLAVISTPIGFHAEQSCALLNAGFNVLCEKPMAATLGDALTIKETEERSNGFIEIGYQWSFSKAITLLKSDILKGRFGAPKRYSTRIAWPRTSKYFLRNQWAGRLFAPNGQVVNDSPVNNAMAHFLHNMLYLAGPSIGQSATPVKLTAECYRANEIQNFDTACCRVLTEMGPEILFFGTHAIKTHDGPVFNFEFEYATVELSTDNEIIAKLENGESIHYGSPDIDPMQKLKHCLNRIRFEQPNHSICGPDAAIAHTICVDGFCQIPIQEFPIQYIKKLNVEVDETLTYMDEMNGTLIEAYQKHLLFSELKKPWATQAKTVQLDSQPLTIA